MNTAIITKYLSDTETKKALCEHLGMSTRTFDRKINRSCFTVKDIESIADFLKLTDQDKHELFEDTLYNVDISDFEREIIKRYRTLTPRQKQLILDDLQLTKEQQFHIV